MRQVFRRYSNPFIPDAEETMLVFGVTFQVNGACFGTVFDGVVEQYRDRLDQALRVTGDFYGGHLILDGNLLGLGGLQYSVHRLAGHVLQGNRLAYYEAGILLS